MAHSVADLSFGFPEFSLFDELDMLESPIKDNFFRPNINDQSTVNIMDCNFINVGQSLYDPVLGNYVGQGELGLELDDLDMGQLEFNNVLNFPFGYPLENVPCSDNLDNLQCQYISSSSDLYIDLSANFNTKINPSLKLSSTFCPLESQCSVADYPCHNLKELSSPIGLFDLFPIEISSYSGNNSDVNVDKLTALDLTSNNGNNWSDSEFSDCPRPPSISSDVLNEKVVDCDENFNRVTLLKTFFQEDKYLSGLNEAPKKVCKLTSNILESAKTEDHFDYKASKNPSSKLNTLLPFKIIVKTKEPSGNYSLRGKNTEMVAPFVIPQASCSIIKIPESDKTLSQEQKFFDSSTSVKEKLLAYGNKSCSNSEPIVSRLTISSSSMPRKDDLKLEFDGQRFQNPKPISTKLNKGNKNINNLRSSHRIIKEPIPANNLPFRSLKRNKAYCQSLKKNRNKVKAYELAPLNDPRMEKCRKNAINAKKNRDLKKVKMLQLQEEMAQERLENEKLAEENESLRLDKMQLERQINNIIGLLEDPNKLTLLIHKLRDHDSVDKLKAISVICQDNKNAIASDMSSC